MQVTKILLKEKFREYNKLYFNGELKMPKFTLFKSRIVAGKFAYRVGHGNRVKDQEIVIGDGFRWTEDLLRDVLVHEMLHYYLVSNGDFRTFPFGHSFRFRRLMKEYNKKYGLHMTIRIRKSKRL